MNVTARLCIPTTAHSAFNMYNVTATMRDILSREYRKSKTEKKEKLFAKALKKRPHSRAHSLDTIFEPWSVRARTYCTHFTQWKSVFITDCLYVDYFKWMRRESSTTSTNNNNYNNNKINSTHHTHISRIYFAYFSLFLSNIHVITLINT